MFQPVDPKVNFLQREEAILKFWQDHDIFRKSMELRKDAPRFVFYEGPPTANGKPHVGHVLTRVFKDLIPRYQTMKGKYCLRKGGWDTHGLPVEIEVEKELGFSGKKAIEDYGIIPFNEHCRTSVFRYVEEWTRMSDRIGFWIDMDDPYVTLHNEYIESVWWLLKQLWDRDFLYQGYKVVPYCPRCGTPLSSHESALGYDTAVDPSIYVRFPLRDQPGTYFLVWTTTPWTLPGNVALAVGADVEYALVQQGDEKLILATALLDQVLQGDYTVVRKMKGRDLLGTHFVPLYNFLPVELDYAYVIEGDFVSTEEGTGIVHIAPAFGEDDLNVGRQYNLPVLNTVDLKGQFIDAVTPWRGLFVKDADPLIIQELQQRGLMYQVGTYEHVYPFCWRCGTPLLYYAKTAWFIETTRVKDRLLANNAKINWVPEHIRDGRFGDWLANNVDWALSRERYWGTPLPIWMCDQCGEQEFVGSIAELLSHVQRSTFNVQQLDLHRPYVDEFTWPCSQCDGGTMRRVPEVIDCWFDSGAMPYAQWHYPFENQTLWAEQFPADFICEAIDQTRGWFYSLHAIATLVSDSPAYTTCLVLGHVLDAEGRKMSKRLGNVVDPWDVLNAHGADALRWYLFTATPPWQPRRFSVDLVGEVVRKFMLTLWNTYSFFVTYANIDGWQGLDVRNWRLEVGSQPPTSNLQPPTSNLLDRWILSELHVLVQRVDAGMAAYDVTSAARPIGDFVDDLSNWYVRRSRRRFWKSEHDADKNAAYATLYECLVTLSKLLAPFTPFLAETLYQNLVRSHDPTALESVHLCDFPVADEARIDRQLMADTRLAMRVASLGHAARNKAGIKVRQPLAEAVVQVRDPNEQGSLASLLDTVADELNVKRVRFAGADEVLVNYRVTPNPALLGPKHGATFPKLRAALAALDPNEVARTAQRSQSVMVNVDGQPVEVLPEELYVAAVDKAGFVVAEEAGYVAAVATTLTDELKAEGLAREVVRRIQAMRKDAGFRIEDHITTYYQVDPALSKVMTDFGDYIRDETLSVRLVDGPPPASAFSQAFTIDGVRLTLGVKREM
jgi:isoleucyl-tRNA synthetase